MTRVGRIRTCRFGVRHGNKRTSGHGNCCAGIGAHCGADRRAAKGVLVLLPTARAVTDPLLRISAAGDVLLLEPGEILPHWR